MKWGEKGGRQTVVDNKNKENRGRSTRGSGGPAAWVAACQDYWRGDEQQRGEAKVAFTLLKLSSKLTQATPPRCTLVRERAVAQPECMDRPEEKVETTMLDSKTAESIEKLDEARRHCPNPVEGTSDEDRMIQETLESAPTERNQMIGDVVQDITADQLIAMEDLMIVLDKVRKGLEICSVNRSRSKKEQCEDKAQRFWLNREEVNEAAQAASTGCCFLLISACLNKMSFRGNIEDDSDHQ